MAAKLEETSSPPATEPTLDADVDANVTESTEPVADLELERLLTRVRSEAMFELRKLRLQQRPVSEFCSKQQLERFLTQRNQRPQGASGATVSDKPTNLVAEQARRFADRPQAADPQSLMPEGIRVEVRGLFERRRVSEVLQNPEIQGQLESALREDIARRQRRLQRRVGRRTQARAQHEPDTRGGVEGALLAAMRRGRVRAGTGRRVNPRPTGHHQRRAPPSGQGSRQYPPPPRRDQSQIVEQVRQSPALNSLNPQERDRVVAEIGHLVQQQLVSTALAGEFRGVLELHIQERADRLSEGVTDQDYFEATLSRRQAHSADAYQHRSHDVDDVSSASLAELRGEMSQVKAQLLELKQMMRVSFDLQLDIQRAIRQEVAAALAAFCTPQISTGVSVGEQQPAINLQGAREPSVIDSGNCVICSEAAIDSVVYRCGHMCVCIACGLELKAQGLKCPICRSPITDIVRAYTSML